MSTSSFSVAPFVGAIVSAVVGALAAGADAAMLSLSPTRLEALIEQSSGPRKATFERIRRDDAALRSRYLVGRIAATALTFACLTRVLLPYFPELGLWIALGASVVLMAVLFEVSTTLGRTYADYVAPAAARYLRPLELVLAPLATPLGWLGSRVIKGKEPPSNPKVTEAEVEALLDVGERSGLFAREPAEIIRNVLDFVDRTAKDAAIPRSKVEAIDITLPIEDVLERVTESGHSRYPVYKGELDNIIGLLYAKDLFKAMHIVPHEGEAQPRTARPSRKSIEDLVRTPANFVAESQPLSVLLKDMRAKRNHLAIVVDELGAVSGIVTLEDVLEEIVGDIRDEHDDIDETPAEAPVDMRVSRSDVT